MPRHKSEGRIAIRREQVTRRISSSPRRTALPHLRLSLQTVSIRAKFSSNNGKTWSKEITPDDAAAWDIGYPRSVQRTDGKVVTIYYYNDAPHRERFIAATIWDPEMYK
jgi:hypothetical protein